MVFFQELKEFIKTILSWIYFLVAFSFLFFTFGLKEIEFFGKKGGKEFRDRQRIRKEGKLLASNVSILAKIGELAPKEFEKAKQLFIAFQQARTTSKGALIKQYSQEFVDLIKIDRDEFLKFTRDPNLLASLQHLFKLT